MYIIYSIDGEKTNTSYIYRGNDENTKKYFFQQKIQSHKMIEHKLKRNVKEKEL